MHAREIIWTRSDGYSPRWVNGHCRPPYGSFFATIENMSRRQLVRSH
jgi:hypothetical protein